MVKNYNYFIEGMSEVKETPLHKLKYFEKHNILPKPEVVLIGKKLRRQYSMYYLLKLKKLKSLIDQGLTHKEVAALLNIIVKI